MQYKSSIQVWRLDVAGSGLDLLYRIEAAVLKTFHARAGASMDAFKRKNTAREVKGSVDASFRADLKSKVSQATKKAVEFQIRKSGGNMLTGTIAETKKGKPTPKPAPADGTEVVEEEGQKG
jgi:hypothetical protein